MRIEERESSDFSHTVQSTLHLTDGKVAAKQLLRISRSATRFVFPRRAEERSGKISKRRRVSVAERR